MGAVRGIRFPPPPTPTGAPSGEHLADPLERGSWDVPTCFSPSPLEEGTTFFSLNSPQTPYPVRTRNPLVYKRR